MVLLAVLVGVVCWSILSGPVCTASEESDPQNSTFLDTLRRLLSWSAVDDVALASEDSVEDDDYPDHEADERAEVCQRIEKSTLHERFLAALDRAKRADRPWWFAFFGAFTDASMSCPANKDKEKEGDHPARAVHACDAGLRRAAAGDLLGGCDHRHRVDVRGPLFGCDVPAAAGPHTLAHRKGKQVPSLGPGRD
ncbi:hypothetical protein MTO96_026061 [Rhipicephalus appendiculatus]